MSTGLIGGYRPYHELTRSRRYSWLLTIFPVTHSRPPFWACACRKSHPCTSPHHSVLMDVTAAEPVGSSQPGRIRKAGWCSQCATVPNRTFRSGLAACLPH